ncbi:MAG: O-antigen ligase family protein, partial [Stagnimonas sp.]|nr:O-antigen ligase family protein [Stagnimonas sp.]
SGFPTIEQALGPLTGLLGRDLTFTGRVPLWGAVLDEIPQRPLLGAGFQAFWGPPGSLSDAARAKAGWISVNGHNGYLDTANELGLIGLALVLAAIAFDLRRARRLAALAPSVFALHAALHLYQLIANLSETMFWRAISMTFLLTTLSSFHLARIELDLDLRRRSGESLPNPPLPEAAHAHP